MQYVRVHAQGRYFGVAGLIALTCFACASPKSPNDRAEMDASHPDAGGSSPSRAGSQAQAGSGGSAGKSEPTSAGTGSNDEDAGKDAEMPTAGSQSIMNDAGMDGAVMDAGGDGGDHDAGDGGDADAGDADGGDGGDAETPIDEPGVGHIGGPCTEEGDYACDGHASRTTLICADGKWRPFDGCTSNERCETAEGPDRGTCLPIALECVGQDPDTDVCGGNAPGHCGIDLTHFLSQGACPTHSTCVENGGEAACQCDFDYADDGAGGCEEVLDCMTTDCGTGVCIEGVGTASCNCAGTGYRGDHCEIEIDHCMEQVPMCANGSECVNELNGYSCDCSGLDYNGPYCDQMIDDCSPNPCNGGVCADEGLGVVSCDCSNLDAEGDYCQLPIDDCAGVTCQHGECEDLFRSFRCNCDADYQGTYCQEQIDDCNPDPCNGGDCTDGIESATCDCSLIDYQGEQCEAHIDDCAGNPCEHGTCVDLVRNFACDCGNSGFEGSLCQLDVDECLTDNGGCYADATCINNVGAAASCECPALYAGDGVGDDGCVDPACGPASCATPFDCADTTPGITCVGQFPDWPVSTSPTNRFTASNGVVNDSLTGLLWQQAPDVTTHTQDGAIAHCSALSLDGNDAWRTPTKAELESLVDFAVGPPMILERTGVFTGTPSARFWSALPYEEDDTAGWTVSFGFGASEHLDQSQPYYVRCVR